MADPAYLRSIIASEAETLAAKAQALAHAVRGNDDALIGPRYAAVLSLKEGVSRLEAWIEDDRT